MSASVEPTTLAYASKEARLARRKFRWLARPPGWVMHALTVIATLWVCWDARFPGRSLPIGLGIVLLATVLVVWILRPLIGLWVCWRTKLSSSVLAARSVHWLVVPVLLSVTLLALAAGAPARISFWVSRPAMERVAKNVLAGKRQKPGRVGLLHFSGVHREADGVQFTYTGKEFPWGRRGLFFGPRGTPSNSGTVYDQDSPGGAWYAWHNGGW